MMKNDISGVLLFNKPQILSSNIALQKVKRLYNAKKAGHTGTLDPLATGLLPICFGEATKFSAFLLDADKEYIATIKLGETTTTYDSCGDILECRNVDVTKDDISNVIKTFLGEIVQIPPIYSALKVNGKRLYEYARSGEEVVIKSRQITIKELEILEFIAHDILKIRVLCSKGTYIRTLAHDIGIKLGCGAHLINLIRSKTSGFILDEKINMENLAEMPIDFLHKLLLPVDSLVSDLLRFDLTPADFSGIKNGQTLSAVTNLANGIIISTSDIISSSDVIPTIAGIYNTTPENPLLRLYFDDKFVGIAKFINNKIKPIRLMNLSNYV